MTGKNREIVTGESGRFDLQALARSLPESAETMLIDKRLTDEPSASSRIFRIYTRVPGSFPQDLRRVPGSDQRPRQNCCGCGRSRGAISGTDAVFPARCRAWLS
jgi:hypothetical protein